MLTAGNLPRKSAEGRSNTRHKAAVRHHGDHYIEAFFIAPKRRQGKLEEGAAPMISWKERQRHNAVTPTPKFRERRTSRKMLRGAVV